MALALAQGVIGEDDTAVLCYDLDGLGARYSELLRLFPPDALHAVAVKAMPMPSVLDRLVALGAGLEAASLPELHLALAAGCPPERIVFDSPAKTVSELRQALAHGVHINADNFQELDRLDALTAGESLRATIGLRVNPQVGQGTIAATSVAGEYSKFGEPVAKRKEIVEAYARRPWLTGLHMHVGSQGCGLELFTHGAKILMELRSAINTACGREQVVRVDVGGGLPVAYSREDVAPSMGEYAAALRRECPGLFAGRVRIFTEFGRWVFANQGFAASRVEYVKEQPGHRTAVIHLGADMFLRTCYAPETWKHEFAVARPDGTLKEGPGTSWNIAGPLCFSGDFLAKSRSLPDMTPGDFILVLDAGAYTYAMWSRYNSRQMPKVIGITGGRVLVLKERESVQDVVDFWT
ncbi:MAG: diaminopimelate decarboxylase [Desulfovibrio sp.]|nr:diaminopimelate decarboxylase [Desulfovibrio sp.]MBI4959991.1 diaminopimelate decarboxylase [Desulfovibrio sp.]